MRTDGPTSEQDQPSSRPDRDEIAERLGDFAVLRPG